MIDHWLDVAWSVIKVILIDVNPTVYKTLTLFELIALVLAVGGLIYAEKGIDDARFKLFLLRRDGRNGILLLTALENLRVEVYRRNKLAVVFFVAIVASVTPTRNPNEVSWAGSAVSLLLIYLIFLLSYGAYKSSLYREAMDREIEKHDIAAKLGRRRKEDKNANEMGLSDS